MTLQWHIQDFPQCGRRGHQPIILAVLSESCIDWMNWKKLDWKGSGFPSAPSLGSANVIGTFCGLLIPVLDCWLRLPCYSKPGWVCLVVFMQRSLLSVRHLLTFWWPARFNRFLFALTRIWWILDKLLVGRRKTLVERDILVNMEKI